MAIDAIYKVSSADNSTSVKDQQTVNNCSNDQTASTTAQNTDDNTQKNGDSSLGETCDSTVRSAISQAKEKIKMTQTRCEFEYHEKTKRISIKVIDKNTDEVVREIPPEETQKMVEKLWELAGLCLDEKR